MKREFLPYYVSRAILSGAFSILSFGLTWKALILGVVVFALFLLYLHSGWFVVDLSNPLFPIRRDQRAREVQRKAMIAAVVAAAAVFLALSYLPIAPALSAAPARLAVTLAIVVYFASQFVLLARI